MHSSIYYFIPAILGSFVNKKGEKRSTIIIVLKKKSFLLEPHVSAVRILCTSFFE